MISNKVLVSGLIGLVIGAAGMGVLDANRPTPLFSSAWLDDDKGSSCKELFDKTIQTLKDAPDGETVNAEQIKELEEQKKNCGDSMLAE